MVKDDRMNWGRYLASGAPLWLKFRHFLCRPKLFLCLKLFHFDVVKKYCASHLYELGLPEEKSVCLFFYLHETFKHTFSDAIIKKAKLVIRCVMSRLEDTPQMCSASQTYDEA